MALKLVITLLPGLFMSIYCSAQPLVIAHRGASGYLPEHSLESKVLAFAQFADYLEQDLVMTSDDALVVFHDLTLDRMTDVASQYPGRARQDGQHYVIDFTLAEIRSLHLHEGTINRQGQTLAQFPDRFPADQALFRIHTFEEELDLIQGLQVSTGRQVGIYPELKSPWFHHQHGKDISSAVLKVLKTRGYDAPEDPVFLQSFDYPELVRVKTSLFPALGMQLKLVQLIAENAWQETMERRPDGTWQPYDFNWMLTAEGLLTLSQTVAGVGPSISMLIEPALPVTQLPASLPWVEAAHRLDLTVHPYTFRRESGQLPAYAENLQALIRLFVGHYHVDGVFTDFPDIAVAVVSTLEAADIP